MPNIHEIRSIDELEKVFIYLCYNSSSIINIEGICKELDGVSKPTVEKYIQYLAEANLINISQQLNIQGNKGFKPMIAIVTIQN